MWSQPSDAGHRPSPRFGHSMVVVPGPAGSGSDGGGRLLVLGGCLRDKEGMLGAWVLMCWVLMCWVLGARCWLLSANRTEPNRTCAW